MSCARSRRSPRRSPATSPPATSRPRRPPPPPLLARPAPGSRSPARRVSGVRDGRRASPVERRRRIMRRAPGVHRRASTRRRRRGRWHHARRAARHVGVKPGTRVDLLRRREGERRERSRSRRRPAKACPGSRSSSTEPGDRPIDDANGVTAPKPRRSSSRSLCPHPHRLRDAPPWRAREIAVTSRLVDVTRTAACRRLADEVPRHGGLARRQAAAAASRSASPARRPRGQAARSFPDWRTRRRWPAAAEVLEILGLMHGRRADSRIKRAIGARFPFSSTRSRLPRRPCPRSRRPRDGPRRRPAALEGRPISAHRRVIWRRERPVRDSTSLTVCA